MFKNIPVEKIYSKSNVRKEQDDSILDLMGDIQRNGLLQLTENVQRRQMSAYELVQAFDLLKETYGCTDIQISKMLHKSSNYVADQRYAVKLLEAQYGKDIPEDKKKQSAGVIKASVKKATQCKSEYLMGKGFTGTHKGHSYMINCNDYEFEKVLNDFLQTWRV